MIYTSDNGYFWGERGVTGKRWPYEESIRIPLLLRWPGHYAPLPDGLYDLQRDPNEKQDLSSDPRSADVKTEIIEELNAFYARAMTPSSRRINSSQG